MKSRKSLALLAVMALAMTLAAGFAVVTSSGAARWLIAGLQIGILVLLLDIRRAGIARVRAKKRGDSKRSEDRRERASRALVAQEREAQEAEAQEREALARNVRRIRASLVFDQDWYEAQTGETSESLEEAIGHYLAHGPRHGHSPHPLFCPEEYLQAGPEPAVDPLLAYLENSGDRWSAATSPLFDPAYLDPSVPEDEFGPLSAFLRHRGSDSPLPYRQDQAFARGGLTLEDIRPVLLERCQEQRERDRHSTPRQMQAIPPEESPEIAESLRAFAAIDADPPLVSIIVPTWNSATTLPSVIDAVTKQSYVDWELIVVDDGSTDDTCVVLEDLSAQDPRIATILLPHSGVYPALNAGLARARGEFVAFLDPDAVWEPSFLQTMVAFLEVQGRDAGYSVIEVEQDGAVSYRAVPAARESLLAGNGIDQSCMVARRSVIERTGGFDESLPRAADYDLILSLSELTELVQVPFVGVHRGESKPDQGRIGESSVAWNHYVSDRRRWAHTELVPTKPGLVSIVIDAVASADDAARALENVTQHLGGVDAEVLLVVASPSWPTLLSVALAEFSTLDVRVIAAAAGSVPSLRINQALRSARGEHVYVTTAHHRHHEGDLEDLVVTLAESGAAVVHPVVLDRRRLVSDAGVVYAPGGRDPIGLLGGMPADWAVWSSRVVPVPGATLPLLMRASTVRAIRGMTTTLAQLWADVDTSQTAARHEAKPVVVRTDNVVQLRAESPFAPRKDSDQDARMFASRWSAAPSGSDEAIAAAGASASFQGFTSVSVPNDPAAWSRAVWRPADASPKREVAERPARPLQWSIKIAAPADERAVSWGDYHFAQSMASALRSLGQRASVDYRTNLRRGSRRADDVVLTLRGVKSAPLATGATSVIWVISHPDMVSPQELAGYDLRYAASSTWPGVISDQWGLQVETLLQCTDPERFYIDDRPEPSVQGKVLMVGNTRGEYRIAACEAARAGFPVAVYGRGWEKFLGEQFIQGTYVANEELRRYYLGADWVLNDHWEDMRDHGFFSNRIFDVLASGGRLVTDHVAGLEALVPESVLPQGIASFRSPVDLVSVLEAGSEQCYPGDGLKAVSEHVRSEHSFLARASVLLDDVLRHRRSTDDQALLAR